MEWALLRGVPEPIAEQFLAAGRRRRYPAGGFLFQEGESGDTLFLIEEGRIAVRAASPSGEVVTLALVGPGQILGELGVVSRGCVRTATAVALEPCEALLFRREDVVALIAQHPQLAEVILDVVASRLRALDRYVLDVVCLPAETRVRRRLLELAELYAGGDGEIVVELSQEDLAGISAVTRSTVNRILREETRLGTVRLGRRKIVVLDRAGLRSRAWGDGAAGGA